MSCPLSHPRDSRLVGGPSDRAMPVWRRGQRRWWSVARSLPTLLSDRRRGGDLFRQGPIASPRKAFGERTRIVVERRAEQGPARADPVDLVGRVPRRGRALPGDRVGRELLPERQRLLLQRQFACGLRYGVDQVLKADAELLPPRACRCGIEARASETLGLRRCDPEAGGVQALCQRGCVLERREPEPQPGAPGLIDYLARLLG